MGTISQNWKRILRRFSIEHLWCLTTIAGIFAFLSTHPIRPHDFWWHVKVGQEVAKTGNIPVVDTFSFTALGEAYPSYQSFWLMELVLYRLHAFGGPALVVFVHSLVITTAYSIILWLCHRLSRSWRVAALCTLFAASLGLNDWNVRPQMITFLLAAALLGVIYRYRVTNDGQKDRSLHPLRLAVIFLVMVLWVNSHGSFPIGLVMLVIWFSEAAWRGLRAKLAGQGWSGIGLLRRPLAALLVAALGCLINPRGVGIVAYLGSIGGNPVIQNLVPEWMPPTFATLHGALFFIALLTSATILALSPRRPDLSQILTFLSFAALSLQTSRGVVWFGLAMAPVLADHLPPLAQQVQQMVNRPLGQGSESQSLLLNYVFAGLIMAGVLVSLPWFKGSLGLPEAKAGLLSSETPVDATNFLLQNRPPPRLFHEMSFGSYLIWAAHPEYSVFVDPRIELFPAQIWQDYLAISAGRCDWEQHLNEYGINTLMLSPQVQGSLVEAATESPHWQLVYEDLQGVVFVREPAH